MLRKIFFEHLNNICIKDVISGSNPPCDHMNSPEFLDGLSRGLRDVLQGLGCSVEQKKTDFSHILFRQNSDFELKTKHPKRVKLSTLSCNTLVPI